MLPSPVPEIAAAVRDAGGRALVVGGFVRDHLLGVESKDLDVEVFGLDLDDLGRVLERFGTLHAVGRAFGVLRVKGLDIDFSLPRRDSKAGPGHRGFRIELDPGLDFAAAARRRDLTVNSIALDPLTGEVLDPHGGREDLAGGVLRATDPGQFPEDPLRGMRVAQLSARLEMAPDPQLLRLCAGLDLAELSPERLFEEWRKLLVKGRRPSRGLEFLRATGLLRFFPEVAALVGVPQDPQWHPEGDVWVHTLKVVDEAAALRDGTGDDLALMLGALCHDFGKPATTVEEGGRIRSPEHDVRGIEPTRAFLARLRAPGELVDRVATLVRYHLAPAQFDKGGATDRAYRRLARKLERGGVSMELLLRVARADHLGRTTADALAREFPAGDRFRVAAESLLVVDTAPRDTVQGRHLIARGLSPGPEFGPILARCRDIQDETGWDDPDAILDRALAE